MSAVNGSKKGKKKKKRQQAPPRKVNLVLTRLHAAILFGLGKIMEMFCTEHRINFSIDLTFGETKGISDIFLSYRTRSIPPLLIWTHVGLYDITWELYSLNFEATSECSANHVEHP